MYHHSSVGEARPVDINGAANGGDKIGEQVYFPQVNGSAEFTSLNDYAKPLPLLAPVRTIISAMGVTASTLITLNSQGLLMWTTRRKFLLHEGAYLMLFNIPIPANVFIVSSKIYEIATFDMIPLEWLTDYLDDAVGDNDNNKGVYLSA